MAGGYDGVPGLELDIYERITGRHESDRMGGSLRHVYIYIRVPHSVYAWHPCVSRLYYGVVFIGKRRS